MKNILKLMTPCLAVVFALTSCNDTMDDKSSIDAQFAKEATSTVTLSSAQAVDFQSISASAAVTDLGEVIEEGIQVSTDAAFTSPTSIANDTVIANFSRTIAPVAEQTTYYVRAYIATKASGIIVSEAKTVTTPAAPIFPVAGEYVATEYDLDDNDEWSAAAQYDMTIAQDAEDPTIVYISNLWEGGMTIQGQYDESTGQIIVPNNQTIYVHPSYGDVWNKGVAADLSDYTPYVVFQFTALGGKMQSTPMAAQCAAGNFGFFYVTMEHK